MNPDFSGHPLGQTAKARQAKEPHNGCVGISTWNQDMVRAVAPHSIANVHMDPESLISNHAQIASWQARVNAGALREGRQIGREFVRCCALFRYGDDHLVGEIYQLRQQMMDKCIVMPRVELLVD